MAIHSLENDYGYCETIIKEYSKSFYYAFSILDEQDRKAVYSVYAWCRLCDDAVDTNDDIEEAKQALEKIEQDLTSFISGNIPETPIYRALNDVRHHYTIDFDSFYDQINGQQMDVDFSQPKTLYDLELYSDRVAGSVGRILLPILANVQDERLVRCASSLGIAMQYTNILRDIGEDMHGLSRVYIPDELLETYKYDVEDLKSNVIDERFKALWEHLAADAEDRYAQFKHEITRFKPSARVPLVLSILVYREILNEVRRAKYDCLTKRNAVSSIRKLKLKHEAERFVKNLNGSEVSEWNRRRQQ